MSDKQTNIDDLINRAIEPQVAYQKFKGIPFLSLSFYFDSFGLIGGIAAATDSFSKNDYPQAMLWGVGGILLSCFMYNWNMNYLILTDEYLIVKNWFIFWKNIPYKLTDIKDVYFHSAFYHSKDSARSIDITFGEERGTKNYDAAPLLGLEWTNLQKALDAKGISTGADKSWF